MLEIRSEYGWKGYGQYWAILEAITISKTGRVTWPELRNIFDDCIESDYLICLCENGLLNYHMDAASHSGEVEYTSPVLEAQAASPNLSHHLRLLGPRTPSSRPGIPRQVRMAVLSAGCCAYCGSKERLQVDHIYPYSRGGAHSIENFQPLCQPCNSAKRDKTEKEYFALIGCTNG